MVISRGRGALCEKFSFPWEGSVPKQFYIGLAFGSIPFICKDFCMSAKIVYTHFYKKEPVDLSSGQVNCSKITEPNFG